MRYLVLLSLLGAACMGAEPIPGGQAQPVGVDGLSPDDVAKAVSALKESFVRPEALSDPELVRATLQGLLDRLAPEVSLLSGSAATQEGSPFHGELVDGKTGYLRPGDLTEENVAKASQALKEWSGKGVNAVVLDLRGTPASSDFQAGADLERLFCAKGTELFSLAAGKGQVAANPISSDTRAFSADAAPLFTGILVVLVDAGTAEAPEAVAASLRTCAKGLVVGDKTAGQAFEYRDVPLNGSVLRVAIAQVILPDGKEPGEDGVKPDIQVALGGASKQEVMRSIGTKGVDSVIEEHDRPHLNEAALVAGSSPEVDELEAEAAGKKPEVGLIDRQLQRALDLVTSISIYQSKGGASASGGE
jgi:carboxyl-terminal processing protease